ncbi:uncharacterized protein LOC143877386 isoform X2 [Tasmannia lanceolata]|uniref:uncharacterized protein LOC143877386 isoform X2 n=1 Tax=Tasmannia lanceolata TaxID=3420 RepID=UPI0040645D29
MQGHSVTRKLNSDGKVNTMQMLHNLNKDDLAGFEEAWKGKARKHLPGSNQGFDMLGNVGGSSNGQIRQASRSALSFNGVAVEPGEGEITWRC